MNNKEKIVEEIRRHHAAMLELGIAPVIMWNRIVKQYRGLNGALNSEFLDLEPSIYNKAAKTTDEAKPKKQFMTFVQKRELYGNRPAPLNAAQQQRADKKKVAEQPTPTAEVAEPVDDGSPKWETRTPEFVANAFGNDCDLMLAELEAVGKGCPKVMRTAAPDEVDNPLLIAERIIACAKHKSK